MSLNLQNLETWYQMFLHIQQQIQNTLRLITRHKSSDLLDCLVHDVIPQLRVGLEIRHVGDDVRVVDDKSVSGAQDRDTRFSVAVAHALRALAHGVLHREADHARKRRLWNMARRKFYP